MIAAGLIFAALASALHVYIFVLESFLWTAPRTRPAFGTSVKQAEATKEMAFNQGFYNLFLAVVTAVGIVAVLIDATAAGAALIFAGTGSMLLAAIVLLVTSPDKKRAAIVQGTTPLLALVLLTIGFIL